MTGHGKIEPQVFFTRRGKKLAEMFAGPIGEVFGSRGMPYLYGRGFNSLEPHISVTLRNPLYAEDNGNCRVLRREQTRPGQQRSGLTITGYLRELWIEMPYGSLFDAIVIHPEQREPKAGLVAADETAGITSDEVRRELTNESPEPSLEAALESAQPEFKTPGERRKYQEELENIVHRYMQGVFAKARKKRESEYLTDERFKGTTIVPFSEIKDYSLDE